MPRLTSGVDHVAYVTFDPEATVKFYTECCEPAHPLHHGSRPGLVDLSRFRPLLLRRRRTCQHRLLLLLRARRGAVARGGVSRAARRASPLLALRRPLRARRVGGAPPRSGLPRVAHRTRDDHFDLLQGPERDPARAHGAQSSPDRRRPRRRDAASTPSSKRASGEPTLERVWQLKGDRLAADGAANGAGNGTTNPRVVPSTPASIS
jgi:hypothetical protein